MVRWEGERFLVLFKKGGRRVSLIFYLLVSGVNQHFIFLLLMLIKGTKRWSDLNQGNEGNGLKIYFRAFRNRNTLLRLSMSC